METILFFPAYAYGHINRCFRLARDLQEDYQVIFVSQLKYKKFITENGFGFIPIALQYSKINHEKIEVRAFLKYFLTLMTNPSLRKNRKEMFYREMDFFEERIQEINPKIVFLDIFLSHYYPFFKFHQKACICFQTSPSKHRTGNNFPISSYRVPSGTSRGKLLSKWSWTVYFLKVYFNKKLVSLLSMKTDNQSLFTEYCLSLKLDPRHIFDFNRALFPGIKDIPELVFPPRAFDFPDTRPLPNQYYLRHQVLEERHEIDTDNVLNEIIEEVGSNIVYCSFGSLPEVHNRRIDQLVDDLVYLAANQFPEYHFIFSLPGRLFVNGKHAANVHFFHHVPQLRVLQKSVLFITHGGISSVMESLLYEVPMLVCPLNTEWDQPGNAARVQYHNLGLWIKPGRDGRKVILSKIKWLLLENGLFKKNIREFNSKVHDDSKGFYTILRGLLE